MVECPTCDDTFDTERGMKQHHPIVHNESLSKVDLECEWCGETYRKYPSLVDQSERNFCSHDCYASWVEAEQSKEDAPRWNGGTVSVDCEWCGETVERHPHRVNTTEHTFCSADCRGSWFSENQVGEDHHQYQSITLECDNCGVEMVRQPHEVEKHDHLYCSMECRNEDLVGENSPNWVPHEPNAECDNCGKRFYRTPSEIREYEKSFCSHRCMGEWYEENIDPEEHPRWEGGHDGYYGPTWREQRRKTLERDDYECQDCGLTREQHYDEYDTDLEVHHTTPIRTFEDTTEANQLSNLVTLCKSCHQERENNT